MLNKRLKYFGKEQNQWHELIYPILLTYNNKNEHSTIKMTPATAHKKENKIEVKTHIEIKAKRNRKYPDLQIGDKVKIYVKKNKFQKSIFHNTRKEIMKLGKLKRKKD
jgi:hypothetical protein